MDNQITAARIADALHAKGVEFEQKRMFGGECFMVDDKMLIGTYQGGIMARLDPADREAFCRQNGVAVMIHGGRPMNGFLMLAPEVYEQDEALDYWINQCLAYNPKAKSSKKKTKP